MISSIDNSTLPEDPVGAELDDEIAALKAQIASLKSKRKLGAATILSSYTTQAVFLRLRESQKSPVSSSSSQPQQEEPIDPSPLILNSSEQQAHNQQNLYRVCAGVTTFRIRDPDPNAVDNGNVLTIRIDISSTGKFIRPYYVHLNKPFPKSELLRVHRHTLPPCIPISALAARYLPSSKGSVAMNAKDREMGKRQDLRRFVRGLRRELVGYHNRASVIKGLRREFKLDEKVSKKGKARERVIQDISAADAEAKQVSITFIDGRTGRVEVDDKGEVKKCVITSAEDGRDRETERRIHGCRMEIIGERLREGIY